MGNSQTKEARGQGGSSSHQASDSRSPNPRGDNTGNQDSSSRPPQPRSVRRTSRPDIAAFLGIGGAEQDVSSLEARRENKQEREARRAEREKQARLKERERSIREEHVDGGYLVTLGVYVGIEDYSKPTVRQLMIERRLAPFWRGLNDYSESWAEHQLMAAARGMPIPPPDEVPPELEYTLSKRPSTDVTKDRSTKPFTIPIGSRTNSYQSEMGQFSAINSSLPLPSPQGTSVSPPGAPLFRSRAKTLASLGTSSRNNSERDMTPREVQLTPDPFVNGQPVEVYLYKDASECPICFLYYPPYLNTTRCCDQPICSECFVQIKRPDPHPPEHEQPDPNAPPMSEEEKQAQAEGLLVSEVAACPYCKQPEFGITYVPPPFRRGLSYSAGSHPFQIRSATSSQTSISSSGMSPGPGRRRGTSLSANAPEVVTIDKIRPDWATKLAAARAHAARRSAAATALHAAAYLMNGQADRSIAPFGRRGMLRRTTLEGGERPSDAQLNAMAILAERHTAVADRSDSNAFSLAPPRGSSSRRSRMDDLEDMMLMEAIRLSLVAEEERRKKEDKDAKKKAKKDEKDQKKADKAARKNSFLTAHPNGSNSESLSMQRSISNTSSISPEESGKGKSVERAETLSNETNDGEGRLTISFASSMPDTSQESLSTSFPTLSASEPFKRSHLRQMSNASSASSSFQETGASFPGSSTPPVTEPMFNFRSLAAMIGDDEKHDSGNAHVENADGGATRSSLEDIEERSDSYAATSLSEQQKNVATLVTKENGRISKED